MRKHLEVQLAPDLDPHLVDQVDGLVTPHFQLSPVFIQIQSGHIHQVHHTYFRKPDLRTENAKVQTVQENAEKCSLTKTLPCSIADMEPVCPVQIWPKKLQVSHTITTS